MSDVFEARFAVFAYRRPSPEVQAIMTRVRESYEALYHLLCGAVPPCRELSLCRVRLEESGMWAMKALSITDRGGVVIDPPPEETP